MRRTVQALKNPQVQLAIAALTIGIGATTAIYTVVHAVLLEPLPWSDSSRWFYIFGSYRGGSRTQAFRSLTKILKACRPDSNLSTLSDATT
jgi:hypothetical protein